MHAIEIVTIVIASIIVMVPIILKLIKKKKGNCTHVCSTCGKNCPLRNIKNIDLE